MKSTFAFLALEILDLYGPGLINADLVFEQFLCFAFKVIICCSLLIFSQQHQQTLLNQLREVTGTTDIQLLQQALQVRHPSINLSNSPADPKSGCCGSCSSSAHFIAPFSVCSSISGTLKCSQVLILMISALLPQHSGFGMFKKKKSIFAALFVGISIQIWWIESGFQYYLALPSYLLKAVVVSGQTDTIIYQILAFKCG